METSASDEQYDVPFQDSLKLHYDFIVGDINRLLFCCFADIKPSSDLL
jgi:hypothetical protein